MKKLLLIVICCFCLFLTGCEDSSKVKENEKKQIGIGEDLVVTTQIGEYKIKFTKVQETSNRNQFSEAEADRVIIIEYEYENTSLTGDLYISKYHFKLYDKDHNAMETYPAKGTKTPSYVSAGKKTTASVAYALNNSNNYIELEFYDNSSESKPAGVVILEW